MAFHDKQGQLEMWKKKGEGFDQPFHKLCRCGSCYQSVEWRDPSGGQGVYYVAANFEHWVVVNNVAYCNYFCAIEEDREGVEKLANALSAELDSLAHRTVRAAQSLLDFDKPPIQLTKEMIMAAGFSESDAEFRMAISEGKITGCCVAHEPGCNLDHDQNESCVPVG